LINATDLADAAQKVAEIVQREERYINQRQPLFSTVFCVRWAVAQNESGVIPDAGG
jgi:hypothetical protein